MYDVSFKSDVANYFFKEIYIIITCAQTSTHNQSPLSLSAKSQSPVLHHHGLAGKPQRQVSPVTPRPPSGTSPSPQRLPQDPQTTSSPTTTPTPPPTTTTPPHHHHQQQQLRPPVIIYTVSPKVIHTNPNEFMTLVQRLTGPSAPSPVGSSFSAFDSAAAVDSGAVSPAARFASISETTFFFNGEDM
ncbi:putative VQ motif-containing protein/18/20/21/25 [Helianthus annuus]|nr:putative VQ motif-containing protein/18/20/21/25 [Helianthus annuus]